MHMCVTQPCRYSFFGGWAEVGILDPVPRMESRSGNRIFVLQEISTLVSVRKEKLAIVENFAEEKRFQIGNVESNKQNKSWTFALRISASEPKTSLP